MDWHEIKFWGHMEVPDDLILRLKEEFEEITQTGFWDEFRQEIQVLWKPEETRCWISHFVLDLWDEEELQELLEDLFRSAVRQVAEQLYQEGKEDQEELLLSAYLPLEDS